MGDKVTDIEFVLFYINHIDNPCSFEHEGKQVNVRPVYLEQAREILKHHNFENPYAKELLENKPREYS
ncbi:MAG: hypothetical protein AABX29_03560 [Nanoarchaeota archaeon]